MKRQCKYHHNPSKHERFLLTLWSELYIQSNKLSAPENIQVIPYYLRPSNAFHWNWNSLLHNYKVGNFHFLISFLFYSLYPIALFLWTFYSLDSALISNLGVFSFVTLWDANFLRKFYLDKDFYKRQYKAVYEKTLFCQECNSTRK